MHFFFYIIGLSIDSSLVLVAKVLQREKVELVHVSRDIAFYIAWVHTPLLQLYTSIYIIII